MHRYVIGTLLSALIVSWIAFASYHWAWIPFKRQGVLLRVASLAYDRGPVVLVGDSIFASLPHAKCAINIASAGMRASALDANHAAAVASQSPSRVIVLIGINDLRAGAQPEQVARHLDAFARRVRELRPETVVVVLSILPIVENELAARARNSGIEQTNAMVRSLAGSSGFGYIDISGLLGGTSLNSRLTHDGLHLNALGSSILQNVLFQGLALTSNDPRCLPP